MALTHLVDTSVLTRVRHAPVRERLERGVGRSELAVCRLAALELGFSARQGREWDEIQGALGEFAIADVTDDDARAALLVQRELAHRGRRGRTIVDLLVAAVAMRIGVAVLHYDRDFDHIAEVTGQPVEWVAPAGSLD